ncbi:MAG: hypothetical protein V3T71_02480 [Dehalococcoidia bacterium]
MTQDRPQDRDRPRPWPPPPTQHQDLPQVRQPGSASELAVRLTRVAQAVTETQDRSLGLTMDLGAIQAELGTLRAAAVELAMLEPGPLVRLSAEEEAEEDSLIGPAYTDPPRTPDAQRARDSRATARAYRRDTAGDGGERSEHRGPSGPRPRPFAVVIGTDEAWPFAGVAL